MIEKLRNLNHSAFEGTLKQWLRICFVLNLQLSSLDFIQRKFIIIKPDGENEIEKIFKNFPILPSSEIFYFDKNVIKQIYRVSADSSLIHETYGKYFSENDSFVDLRDEIVTSKRRRNLMGTRLNATLVITNNQTLDHLNDYQLSCKLLSYHHIS